MQAEILYSSLGQIREYLNQIESEILLLVIDHNIKAEYGKTLELDEIPGKKVFVWKAVDGEKTKSISEYEACLEFFLSKGIHRKAHLVAIGGGAVSDFAGFVAATLLRGISWSVVPTTLLSMVDACLGGKVGINSKHGKNLIGAFHFPEKIYYCPEFIQSLSENELKSGKGEILKYTFLSPEIAQLVLNQTPMEELIIKCAEYKQKIVANDAKESGLRKILNLGHTFGHGIEKIYATTHGESVVWGMMMIFVLFERKDLLQNLKERTLKMGVSYTIPPWKGKSFPVEELMMYVGKDKKKLTQDQIDLVLPDQSGGVTIEKYALQQIEDLLQEHANELRMFTL